MTGVVGIFIPFSRTWDLIYAIGGCLIFSGYIVYDTYMINRRLSPDEFIMGAISLYLEYVSYIERQWTSTDFYHFMLQLHQSL
jgi:FtsH-binding integral membrane protein